MTIVTKLPSEAEKKKEAEANEVPLVQVEEPSAQEAEPADLQLAYVSLSGRVLRLSRATYLCLVLSLTLATMLGLMAALHVYRSAFLRRNYCGMYRVPLSHGILPENILVAANFQNPREEDDTFKLNMFALFNNNPPTPAHREGNNRDFEFDFELDLDENQFESFELPEIFLGRYMHDFKVSIIMSRRLESILSTLLPILSILNPYYVNAGESHSDHRQHWQEMFPDGP